MTRMLIYLTIVLVSLSMQPVLGAVLTEGTDEETQRELVRKLNLRKLPRNASEFVLNRISVLTFRNNDPMAGRDSANPDVAFEVGTNSFITTDPLTIATADNQLMTLEFEELETHDPTGIVHWLGHVQGDPDSFVRLTFDSKATLKPLTEGPASAQVAGTIITKDKTIKLRPAGRRNYHILYEVKDQDANYLLKLDVDSIDETKARWLEAKGIQRDLLAEMPESSFKIGMRGSLTSLHRDLSHGKLGELEIRNRNDLKQAVEVLAPYYGFTGSEEFVFTNQSRAPRDDIYDLAETINGMAIYNASMRIFVSKENHKITHVLGPVKVDSGFPTLPIMSEEDAKTLALEHMAALKNGFTQFEADEAQLVYGGTETWEPDLLRLKWEINILRDGRTVGVLVDTVSGKVTILEKILH